MSQRKIEETELVWKGKLDETGKIKPTERPGPFPFQIVESGKIV